MLPIRALEQQIVGALQSCPRLVLQAPTGSGKSTQVPQILLDQQLAGQGEIVVLQPRRLPTRMLAARVARERNGSPGGEVGYQMRFAKVISPATRIRFVTEGVLLRQIIQNPALPHVSVIVFDEFHERHLHTDLCLALAVRCSRTHRPDLRIVVMSATLDASSVARYLHPCRALVSEGRSFPVEISYLTKPPDEAREPVWDRAVRGLESVADTTTGDVLIFQPGSREIHRTIRALESSRLGRMFVAFPLHGELPPEAQDAALAPHCQRKVIVATNVAETSLTIEGIRTVIDTGLARIPRFDPVRGINTLLIEKISRASADQRAGRAGRTAPGLCLRLWTERQHGERPAHETPEIRRVDLAEAVLALSSAGVTDMEAFAWLDHPGAAQLDRAASLLRDLGAIGDRGITPIGRQLLEYPIHPRHARMLLRAREEKCEPEIALIAALCQGRSILLKSTGKTMDAAREAAWGTDTTSDFFPLVAAWRYAAAHKFQVDACRPLGIHADAAREVERIVHQLAQSSEPTSAPPDSAAIARCVLAGFSDQLARRLDSGTLRCELVHNRRGTLARESCVRTQPLFVAAEIREIGTLGKDLSVLLSMATAVERTWLEEIFPDDLRSERRTQFDPAQKRVITRHRVLFRDLVLDEGRACEPEPSEAAPVLARAVADGLCAFDRWDDAVEQWITRLNCLAEWFPEEGLAPIGPDDRLELLGQLCYGAVSGREIKDKPVWPVVHGWLSAPQRAFVERQAPERLPLPNGRSAKIQYAIGSPPTVDIRIQELFGVREGFTIAGGRIPVLVRVLAPNHRPVQVTQNLRTFWEETYPEIKPALQRRYPRHEWR